MTIGYLRSSIYTLEGEFMKEQRIGYGLMNFAYLKYSMNAVDLNKTYNHHLKEIKNNQLAIVDTTGKVVAKGRAITLLKSIVWFLRERFSVEKEKKYFISDPLLISSVLLTKINYFLIVTSILEIEYCHMIRNLMS